MYNNISLAPLEDKFTTAEIDETNLIVQMALVMNSLRNAGTI